MTNSDAARADLVAIDIRYATEVQGANPRKAFLELAGMAATFIKMIDERRDAGAIIHPSYNEDVLRAAVRPLLEKR